MHDDDDDAGSPEAGEETRRRHDASSAESADDASAPSRNIGDGNRPERDAEGSNRPEVAADALEEIDEVEGILEGELDESQVQEIISHEQWQGPLPPPAALAAYERVLPGAADRAFTLAERSLDLRRMRQDTVRAAVDGQVTIETVIAEADRDALKRGQYLAAGISGLIGVLSFAGLFLTPWAAIGFTVPLAQVAASVVRTVSDRSGHADRDVSVPDDD